MQHTHSKSGLEVMLRSSPWSFAIRLPTSVLLFHRLIFQSWLASLFLQIVLRYLPMRKSLDKMSRSSLLYRRKKQGQTPIQKTFTTFLRLYSISPSNMYGFIFISYSNIHCHQRSLHFFRVTPSTVFQISRAPSSICDFEVLKSLPCWILDTFSGRFKKSTIVQVIWTWNWGIVRLLWVWFLNLDLTSWIQFPSMLNI